MSSQLIDNPIPHRTRSHSTSHDKEKPVASYRVLINDNFHFMDESERIDYGVFASADEALVACKKIVDDDLNSMCQPGRTAAALYECYTLFGADPFAVSLDPNDQPLDFSAREYAKERSKSLIPRQQ